MPIEPVVEAAVQVVAEGAVQVTSEIAGGKIHRRFGWKGCVFSILAIAAVIALLIHVA